MRIWLPDFVAQISTHQTPKSGSLIFKIHLRNVKKNKNGRANTRNAHVAKKWNIHVYDFFWGAPIFFQNFQIFGHDLHTSEANYFFVIFILLQMCEASVRFFEKIRKKLTRPEKNRIHEYSKFLQRGRCVYLRAHFYFSSHSEDVF
jgi:hypothetical protein